MLVNVAMSVCCDVGDVTMLVNVVMLVCCDVGDVAMLGMSRCWLML